MWGLKKWSSPVVGFWHLRVLVLLFQFCILLYQILKDQTFTESTVSDCLQANYLQMLTGKHTAKTHMRTCIRLHTDTLPKEEGLSSHLCWESDCSVGSLQRRSGCSWVWSGNTQWTHGWGVAPLCPQSEPAHKSHQCEKSTRNMITGPRGCIKGHRPVCLMVPSRRRVMPMDYSPVGGKHLQWFNHKGDVRFGLV